MNAHKETCYASGTWLLQGRRTCTLFLVGLLSIFVQASNCRSTVPQEVLMDESSPTVVFDGLRQYSRMYVHVPLNVIARDDVGISRVELYVDGALFATRDFVPSQRNALAKFNWNAVPVGKRLLQAKAVDAAGNAHTTAIAVMARKVEQPLDNTIVIIPEVRHQTMQGWEATDQAGQFESAAWQNYKDVLFDQAVNDLGINRVRLEVFSGMENPTDYFTQWQNNQIPASQYFGRRYEIINDNSNPASTNVNGFKWSALDHSMTNIVLPLRQRLQARGETLWINVNYVDFGSSPFEHKADPAEYAEFVLAAYQHLQSTYGLTPDSWEIVLEPDTPAASWSADQVAMAIKAAGERLVASGFTPNFVAPSTTSASTAPGYIDQIAATPGSMQYVKEFSYHRYAGVSQSVLQSIADRAILFGKRTSMLEWIGADQHTLHDDIKFGRISAWQQYTLAFIEAGQGDNGAQYYQIHDQNPANPSISLGTRSKYLRHYFRFVRAGAQRIEAISGNGNFDPVAFINTDGKFVVVVKAQVGGTFRVRNLPNGVYGIKYSTGSTYDVGLADVSLAIGQVLTTTIPASGVMTIYRK